uniref:Protein Red n=1 Tax=Schistocephalus solidus TaxID=70667 RepID=A0A0X3PLG3_SCHSO
MEQPDVSNPLAPNDAVYLSEEQRGRHPMSNSDFRKLLMTPRPVQQQKASTGGFKDPSESVRSFSGRSEARGRPIDPESQPTRSKGKSSHKRHHGVKHRKSSNRDESGGIAGSTDGESGGLQYRDRARERREGRIPGRGEGVEAGNDDHDVEQDEDMLMRTADYRAVAPTTAAGASHAERRREIIKESKYLGGDMEHTHLVKGLDYVLLQKVRMEIQSKEQEADELLNSELQKPLDKKDEGLQFRTRLAANVFEILFKKDLPERNEYFQPGRMAYRVDLEDELAEFDVPATVIRSKADCPYVDQQESGAMTTNDIVINKLTQIFSYLRAGRRQAKKAKAKLRMAPNDPEVDYPEVVAENKHRKPVVHVPIYEDVPSDYLPPLPSAARSGTTNLTQSSGKVASRPDRHGDAERRWDKPSQGAEQPKSRYFERPEPEAGNEGSTGTNAPVNGSIAATTEFMRDLAAKYGPKKDDEQVKEKASLERLLKKSEISGYDECYPGFAESYDAMGDSDDETDFSKMDLGNKKGPIGRWDFETQEEYGEYMSNKEAMPKAAFQYGVKKPEGRRTRRLGGGGGGGPGQQRNDKVDREWQQIQAIISKRKQQADDDGPQSKAAKH